MKFPIALLTTTLMCSQALAGANHSHKGGESYQAEVERYCRAISAPIKRVANSTIYSWTDEHGNTHFTDKPPQGQQVQEENLQGRDIYFGIDITYPDSANQLLDTRALARSGRAVYKVFKDILPRHHLGKSEIDMQVFSNHFQFLRLKNKVAPNLSDNVGGFYSGANNLVAVMHMGDLDLTREIALHEATHVIQFANLGMIPGWLTEGLAEYFQVSELQGDELLVPIPTYWQDFFGKNSLVPLKTLLDSDYSNWQGDDGLRYYGSSWALSYYLMQPKYRHLMETFLVDVSENRCDETDSIAFFNKHYEGGVYQLNRDLVRWMAASGKIPNTH